MKRRDDTNGKRAARCTIYEHHRTGGPFCDCGSLIVKTQGSVTPFSTSSDTQTIAIHPDALLKLLKETSQEFRDWLTEQEAVND